MAGLTRNVVFLPNNNWLNEKGLVGSHRHLLAFVGSPKEFPCASYLRTPLNPECPRVPFSAYGICPRSREGPALGMALEHSVLYDRPGPMQWTVGVMRWRVLAQLVICLGYALGSSRIIGTFRIFIRQMKSIVSGELLCWHEAY